MLRRRRLSGTFKVNEWSKGKCFREFRGRGGLIETCLHAVKNTTDLIVNGKAEYYSDAVNIASKDCMKIKNLNEQMACITGVTEVLLRSKGQTASLEGKKRKRRRR